MHAAITAIGLVLMSYAPGDALAERVTAYKKAEGVEARCAALAEIAELAKSPDGPGAEAVARALAGTLHEKLPLVRVRAVELLAGAGAPEVALPALLAATKDQIDTERRIWKEIQAPYTGKLPGSVAPRAGESEKEAKAKLDALERLRREAEGKSALHQELREWSRVRTALVAAFATLRDDRCIDGLDLLLEKAGHDPAADPAVDALLARGTSRALDSLVEHVARYESWRRERDKERREVERQRPRKNPDDGRSDEAWEESERRRIESELAAFDEFWKGPDEWVAALCVKLREFGAAHGLGGAPTQPLPARAWRDWAAKNRGLLPASLAPAPSPKGE